MTERVRRPVALVTGASTGIGAGFARALAARGWDLVLVARDEARLHAVAADVAARFGAESEVLPADLVDTDALARVEARLEDPERPIDLLVNNAGLGRQGPFAEVSRDRHDYLVRLNVLALMRLSHAALGPMIERGHGGLINVSSLAWISPTPGTATYGASKAFVTSLTEALHEEARGTGVRVMAFCPGFVRTEFHERGDWDKLEWKFMWMQPDPVAEAGLVDFDRGLVVSSPGWIYRVIGVLGPLTPHLVTRRIASFLVRRRRPS